MTRYLTESERKRVRALCSLTPKLGGGYWVWPTDEAIALERELSGAAQQTRERILKMKAALAQKEVA